MLGHALDLKLAAKSIISCLTIYLRQIQLTGVAEATGSDWSARLPSSVGVPKPCHIRSLKNDVIEKSNGRRLDKRHDVTIYDDNA